MFEEPLEWTGGKIQTVQNIQSYYRIIKYVFRNFTYSVVICSN